MFVDSIMDYYLYQHITDQTRIREGQHSNTLDLVLTNKEHIIENPLIELPHGMIDRVGLFVKFLCYTSKSHRAEYKILWNKGDYNSMNEIISNIQWEVILSNQNVDEQWHTFFHYFFTDQLIPRRKVNSNPNRQLKKLWMNTDAPTNCKKKHMLSKIYMLSQKKYCIVHNQAKVQQES